MSETWTTRVTCDAWTSAGTRCKCRMKNLVQRRIIDGRTVALCRTHAWRWETGDVVELQDGRYRKNFRGKFDGPSDRENPQKTSIRRQTVLQRESLKRRAGVVNLDSPESVKIMDFYLRAYEDEVCYSAKEAAEMLSMHPGTVSRVILGHPELFFGTVRLSDNGAKFWKARRAG